MPVIKGPDESIDNSKLTNELIEQYATPLLRVCCLRLGDRQLAEDAVSETFFKVYKGLPQFRGDASYKTFILRVAENVCRDMLRRRKARHAEYEVEFDEAAEQCAEAEVYDNSLFEAVRALPDKLKTAILLYYYEDMNEHEIARVLRITPSAVSRRLTEAKRRLREMLKEEQT